MWFTKVWDFPDKSDLLEKILEDYSNLDFDCFWSFLVSEYKSWDKKQLTGKESPLELLSTWKKWRKEEITRTSSTIKDKTHEILD